MIIYHIVHGHHGVNGQIVHPIVISLVLVNVHDNV